jgi:hypothetical protein
MSKGVTDYLGMRMRNSSRFVPDISNNDVRWWLGTFGSTDEAVHAYDMAVWRVGYTCHDLNFPDVESMAEAEFLTTPQQFVDYDVRR